MAFQLLIARGNSEGQQFVVVQPIIRIGRDDDNDVVLSDAGVSRQHTRIFENLGRPWIEDLGSANGTLVNGEKLAMPRELKTGDALAIGAALINFVEIDDLRRPAPRAVPSVPVAGKAVTGEHPALSDDVVTASGEEDPDLVPWDLRAPSKPGLYDDDEHEITAPAGKPLFGGEDHTQPVGKPLVGPPYERKKPEPSAPRVVVDPELRSPPEPQTELGVPTQSLVSASVLRRAPDLTDQVTSMVVPDTAPNPKIEGPTQIKAMVPNPPPSINRLLRDPEPVSDSLAPIELSRSDYQKLAEATLADGKPLVDEPSARPPARHTDAIPAHESAADRARKRRQINATLGSQALHWWTSLPVRSQATATGLSALIAVLAIFTLAQLFRSDEVPLPPEPGRLQVSSERIRRTFGLGDGVDYPRSDSKDFSFDFVTPTEAALLVHYQAQDIDRDEVVVTVNGQEVGFVPPDIGVPDREIETLITQHALKRGEKNVLTFDNTRNPPGKERWRVGHIWLELLPVPPTGNAEAIRRARDLAKQAGQLYAQRDVGSENVFRSWKAYRQSWQLLLVVPEGQRTSLFEQARRKADEIGQELDRQCGQLMLEAKKQMELKNPEGAKDILTSVTLYFPTNEHRCHALANEKLDEYQL